MICSELENAMDPYLDDTLTEEVRDRVERHLMMCESCAFKTRSLEQAREMLRDSFAHEETTPGFRERLAAKLHSEFEDVLIHPSDSHPSQLELPFLRLSAS